MDKTLMVFFYFSSAPGFVQPVTIRYPAVSLAESMQARLIHKTLEVRFSFLV